MESSRLFMVLTFLLAPLAANAAPAGDRLLAMVPQDAQMVTGMKVTRETEARAQLTLVTHNNNVDFNDWLAMVSVDPQLTGHELVEAAASSARGELTETLLLVDGSFDAAHVYRSVLQAGAEEAEFAGVRVLIVQPLPRDREAQAGVRWLVIPDDRTALFGTPLLVQKALGRRAAHAQIDPALAARLQELKSDVDDWSILAMPWDVLRRHLGNAYYLEEAMQALARSDDIVMGIRYGRSTATIDFVAHPDGDVSEASMAVNARAELSAARLSRVSSVRLKRIAVDSGRIVGTLTVSEKRLDVARR